MITRNVIDGAPEWPEEFLKIPSKATCGSQLLEFRNFSGTLWPVFRCRFLCSTHVHTLLVIFRSACRNRLHLLARCFVLDVIFIGLTIFFFVISLGYVAVCDRLMK